MVKYKFNTLISNFCKRKFHLSSSRLYPIQHLAKLQKYNETDKGQKNGLHFFWGSLKAAESQLDLHSSNSQLRAPIK